MQPEFVCGAQRRNKVDASVPCAGTLRMTPITYNDIELGQLLFCYRCTKCGRLAWFLFRDLYPPDEEEAA